MKVKLLRDVSTPEGWIGGATKERNGWVFKAGQVVEVIPTINLPEDSDIKFWVDEESVADNPYGIGLVHGDYELIEGGG